MQETATLIYKAEKFETELVQARYELEQHREAAQIARHQLKLTTEQLVTSEKKQHELHVHISQLEQELQAYQSLKERSQTAIAGLQQVARESQDQVIKLETRLRQMLEKKDKENQNVRERTSEGAHFLKQIAQRIGVSELNASYDHVFNKLLEKLDRTALLELKYAQNEAQMTKTLKELDTIKTSGNELTKRNEQFLNEKKVVNEKMATLDAQLTDVQSQLQLAQTSMKAKDKQLQDLHKQLQELTAANEKEKKNAEDSRFKGDVAKMQLKSMLDSLAASLTTIEHPCASTEVGVKEAVLRLLDRLKCMKESGMMFQQRVADLQAQFESQFKTGKAINEELDQARRRIREAETDKSKLETEVLGLRLLVQNEHGDQKNIATLTRRLCERLGLDPGDDGLAGNSTLLTMAMDSIEQLLSHGCLLQSCLVPKCRTTRCDYHAHVGHIPSRYHSHALEPTRPGSAESVRAIFCDHCGTHELLEVIWRGDGKLSEANQARMRELCPRCLQQLILAASEQLHRARMATHLTPRLKPTHSDQSELLTKLQLELKQEQAHVHHLMDSLAKAEAKLLHTENLDETVEHLEQSRLTQAKRLEKLHKQAQRESVEAKNHWERLKCAKRLLAESQEKIIRLTRFFDIVGRMVNVDTRFEPNPEMLITQRLQQLLEVMRRAGIHQYLPPHYPLVLATAPVGPPPGVGLHGPPVAPDYDGLTRVASQPGQDKSVSFEDHHLRRSGPTCLHGLSGPANTQKEETLYGSCPEPLSRTAKSFKPATKKIQPVFNAKTRQDITQNGKRKIPPVKRDERKY
ncbi:uncharacterized protein DEA37_0008961 [Paragonimus westermani]|uniref:Uncharacterized protein n=1 Tax=Paragonimus westermani TaxID=34504 RepID=A0A5J4NWV3_9TREM|nr:uncharacterized protein DEA37_0008961 [Paragonimus westermani]